MSQTAPTLIWGLEALQASASPVLRWIWHGYLAAGAVTLLTSTSKSGKTTLTAVLLGKLAAGGQFAGLALASGRALVVTEENRDRWLDRAVKLQLVDHVGWFCRPFAAKPTMDQWLALIHQIADEHNRRRLDLVVIDPLGSFLPGHSENNADSMLEALIPLQQLSSLGMAVLLIHHPRRAHSPLGQAARGSSALPAHVDVVVEMRFYPRGGAGDRRRRLQALSRFEETPADLIVQLHSDGGDYSSLGSFFSADFESYWQILRSILLDAPFKLTRRELRRRWPAPQPPRDSTLYRWLEFAESKDLVKKDGRGRKKNPYRYWLPERIPFWLTDPLALIHMPELLNECGTRNSEFGSPPSLCVPLLARPQQSQIQPRPP